MRRGMPLYGSGAVTLKDTENGHLSVGVFWQESYRAQGSCLDRIAEFHAVL